MASNRFVSPWFNGDDDDDDDGDQGSFYMVRPSHTINAQLDVLDENVWGAREPDQPPVHVGTTPNPLEPEGTSARITNLGGSVLQQRDVFNDVNVDADNSDISPSETASETPNDFVNMVPGLYRMLSLYKDNGVSGLVDKIILSPDQMEKLCNDIVPGSFHSISDVNYDKLCQRSLHYIGVYGNPVMIAQLLFSIKAVTTEMLQRLRSESEPTYDNSMNVLPSLSPGIYLYHHKPSDCGLVIHWPERGSFAENASTDKKKNMINLHRYLCKLTDRQVCLMTEDDVASFMWMDEDNGDDNAPDEDEDDDTCFEFKVQSTQEQKEDFTYREGFQIRIPELPNSQENRRFTDVDLNPEIIESIHHQTLATKYYIPASVTHPTVRDTLSPTALRKKLCHFLPTCKLNLPNSILLEDLRTFIDNAGLPYDISQQCFSILEAERQTIQQNYRDQERQAIDNLKQENNAVDKWVAYYLPRYLEKIYPNLAKTTHATGPSGECSLPSLFWNPIEREIQQLIRSVDSKAWKEKKKRLLFSRNLADIILRSRNDEMKQEPNESISSEASASHDLSPSTDNISYPKEEYIQLVYRLFHDTETDLPSLARKHLPPSAKRTTIIGRMKRVFTGDEVKALLSQTHDLMNTTDAEFAKLFLFDDVATSNASITDIKELLREAFTVAFIDWANTILIDKIRRITSAKIKEKSNVALNQLKYAANIKNAELDEQSRQRIRELLMDEFHSGLLLDIVTIKEQKSLSQPKSETRIVFEYKLETPRPATVRVYFHETQLDRTDFQRLGKDAIDDESYCPSPQWYGYGAHKPPSFEYDPQNHSIRGIYQLEDRKILCFMYNKQYNRTELYYEKASRIGSFNFFRKFAGEFKVAYEDVNGLLALYHLERGTLNVYGFDETRSNLFIRNANIEIRLWYNNMLPELSQILFITGTEYLCFVEVDGRVRVYSLITGQFQPADGKFPPNGEVRCSPDGTCLIAFVGKENYCSLDTEGVSPESTPSNQQHDDDDNDDDDRIFISQSTTTLASANKADSDTGDVDAHVYFVKDLKAASKVLTLNGIGNIGAIKITALRGLQPHLLYVKTSHKYFASKILKITVERDLWRFNATNKAAVNLGKVRFGTDASKQDNQLIEGNSTHFSKIINHGDVLLIRGERRTVREILDDMHLVIEGAFPSSLAVGYQDGFLDFKVEPKPNSNGYVDCYAAVYERYPVESCIQDNTNRMASSANTLHIILGISRQQSVDANYPVRFSKHITGTFRRLINQTNKPASSLQYFTTETESIENLNIIHFCQLSKKQEIGQWLIQMACLIPIQIAVAVGGHFVPLKDGLITDIDAILGGNANLAAVSKAITFGWYESIFNFYGDSDVKVVSSMGEQSTGKSYILNHLCGTTFDGSAQRCTEGVWMSTVPTKETLYVVMDFEGLRSLERTPQEDMFLTLFNAAASSLILYKNNFAIGRDISSMFHSFQDGATIFDPSNTLKMFTARLAIIIKDVPKPDRAGIAAEFESKFNETVRKEADRNFISQLYQGELSIMPWPLFNEPSFYTTLAKLKNYLNKQEPKFGKARTFLPTIKTIMAKLKTCDWSSLDDSMVRIRASAVRLLIKQVVASGAEEVEPTLEALKNLDTGDIIEDHVVTLRDLLDSETSESMVNEQEIIPDSGLILLPDPDGVFSDFTAPLRNFFEDNAQRRFDASNDADWYKLYNAFVKQIVARRIRRAKQWFSANTSRFPSDHTDIVATAYDLEQESDRLKAVWSLCGLTCAECNLRCLEQRDHSGEHTCFTDHSCKHACAFTQDHFSDGSMDSSQSPPCAMPAGHDGTHICKDSEHVCGETCSLYGKRNCQGTCNKQPDHTDSIHSCASRVHYCGEPCSLRDVKDSKSASRFSCKNTCIVPYEEFHEIHKCENDNACPLRCCLLQCNKRCDTSNHFHAIDNAGDYHFCGDEHQCFEECKSKGICEIQNQPREQQENYVNKHGTFSYVKYVQTSRRLTCYKKIPVGKFTHAGTHVHGATDMNTGDCFHYCETKCPFCEYYCTLPFGHQQAEHETCHGNMIQTVFSAVDEEFEHEGFIFNTGDRGNSFLCNMYCKGLGRHRHIDYCKTANTGTEPPASCKADGIQHITKKINPDPECPKDFVKHSLYWKRTGFADPYTNEEKELYEKCDVMCSGEEHQLKPSQNNSASSGGGPSSDTAAPKSYCELPLFHAPLFTPPNSATGYVDVDGHYFKCQKPAKSRSDFHIIFVIDRSSSMDASDRKPLRNTPVEAKLRATHNNRLGAVYDAVIRFVDTRHSTLRNRAGVSAATSSNDTLSLVLFGSKAKTVYTNRKLSGSAGLIEEMIKHHPSGATNFAAAIKQATDICVKNYDQSRIPIIVFLSDGKDRLPKKELQTLFDSAATVGAKPYLITVLFGSISGSQVLESMAEFADQYHNKTVAAKEPKSLLSRILLMTTTNASDSLQCRFYTALDEVKLAECFTGIAKSLTDYKPALMARR